MCAVYATMSFIGSDVTITAIIVSLTFIVLGVNSIRVLSLSQIMSSGQMTHRPFREVTYTDEDLLHLDEQLG